jgi:predicted nucleic acid-binding protein
MTSPPVLVPDASVLLKWVLESHDERDRDRALELREFWLSGYCEIVLPSLWFFEVGNILGLKQPRLASQLIQVLIEYRFEEAPFETIYVRAFELMKKYKVTFYDASYHAVAITRHGTLITADNTYHRKTARSGCVEMLADWSSPRRG